MPSTPMLSALVIVVAPYGYLGTAAAPPPLIGVLFWLVGGLPRRCFLARVGRLPA